MGTWGTGIYAGDSAADLRSAIASLARLPIDGPRMLGELRKMEPSADDPTDEDHTIFWLVTADQFVKRAIDCPEAVARALQIIESGQDIALHRELGMSESNLRARGRNLAELAKALQLGPRTRRARKTLSKPQEFLLEVGSAWAYQTYDGQPRNPYFADPAEYGFKPNGWGAMLVLARDRAFGWLAWYAVAPLAVKRDREPSMADVLKARFFRWDGGWSPEFTAANKLPKRDVAIHGGIGSLSKSHLGRMGLRNLCQLEVQPDWWHAYMPNAPWATKLGASDVSIANHLAVRRGWKPGPTVVSSLRTE